MNRLGGRGHGPCQCMMLRRLQLGAGAQMGGLEALQADADKLRRAVEFAAACGAFTTTKPGAIDAQPTREEAEKLLGTASFAPAPAA